MLVNIYGYNAQKSTKANKSWMRELKRFEKRPQKLTIVPEKKEERHRLQTTNVSVSVHYV